MPRPEGSQCGSVAQCVDLTIEVSCTREMMDSVSPGQWVIDFVNKLAS